MKKRLDLLLVEKGLTESRQKAQACIMAGQVWVNGEKVSKAGRLYPGDTLIKLDEGKRFVSRGGEKLEGALKDMDVSVKGLHCLDIGASTGGFTDCLLQHGAVSVDALDVGQGLISEKLRQDKRVKVLERVNARYLQPADCGSFPYGLITMDVSFISVTKIIPVLKQLLAPDGKLLILVKPQFEAGRSHIKKGGVVKDQDVINKVLDTIAEACAMQGFTVVDVCPSRIKGPAGNQEYFMLCMQRV